MQRKKFDVTRLYEHFQPGLTAAFPVDEPLPAAWQDVLARLDAGTGHGPIRIRLGRLKTLLDAEYRAGETVSA